MKIGISFVAFLAAAAIGTGAFAQAVNDEPLTNNWAPSEWGADDKAGAVNRTTPAIVMKAVGLVKQGKVATLGKVYAGDAPAFGSRGFRLTIPGLPTGGPFGKQQLIYNDEYVATELGQIGTQFDGPAHIGVLTSKGHYFYNGRFLEDPDVTAYGTGPLGVEHVGDKGFVCRGVLLDAVALRGGQLPVPAAADPADPGIITADDVQTMIKNQGIADIGEGTVSSSIPDTATSGTRVIGTNSMPPTRLHEWRSLTLANRVSAFRPANIWPNARSS